jgi:hypothetical protein
MYTASVYDDEEEDIDAEGGMTFDEMVQMPTLASVGMAWRMSLSLLPQRCRLNEHYGPALLHEYKLCSMAAEVTKVETCTLLLVQHVFQAMHVLLLLSKPFFCIYPPTAQG